jgi:glycosyltransferase involved in cell wall biosynthesis
VKVAFVPSWYPTDEDPVRGNFFVRHKEALELEHEVTLIAPAPGTSLPRFVAQVVREVARTRPDVVHAHAAVPAGVAALIAARLRRIPVVLSEHTGPLARLYGRNPVRRFFVRRVFEAVDALIVLGNLTVADMHALGVKRELIVMANPIEHTITAVDNPEPLRFAAVGLMGDRTKGFDYLIPAWALYRREGGQGRLRIVGDGSLLGEYRALADSSGAADSIEFVGRLAPSETIEEMALADGVVCSSVYESFGAAPMEAAVLGTPVVSTEVGYVTIFLRGLRDGILVPPRDVKALAAGLAQFAEVRRQFDRSGLRAYAAAVCAPAAICRRTTEIYAQALESRSG